MTSEPNQPTSHRTRSRYSAVPRPAPPSPGSAEQTIVDRGAGGRAEDPHPSGIEREFAERQTFETTLQTQAEFWRQEVAQRVEKYRTRRSRKSLAGQFSMRLDFETSGTAVPAVDSLTITVSGATQSFSETESELVLPQACPSEALEPLPGTPELATAVPDPEPALAREDKLVQFPRTLIFPEFVEPDPNALAEPVFERPRILDVPEAIGVTPAPLSDVALQPKSEEEDFTPPADFDLPLRVAPLPIRLTIAVVDCLLVTVATAMFVAVVNQTTPGLAQVKLALMLAPVAAVLFWAVYHYLFLVHAGVTPGMTVTRVRLSTFDGDHVSRSRRRWRALLMVLSCASLGFGFLWALFDQDNLCWHDKMTRTYLTTDH